MTAKHVLFSNLRKTNVLDMIPYIEIMDLDEMYEDSYLPLTTDQHESTSVLQITTAVDGYNCGRMYRFRPTSGSFKAALLLAIRQNAIEVNKKMTTKARIDSFQRKVRAFYDAKPTQCVVAFLTMSVSLIIDA